MARTAITTADFAALARELSKIIDQDLETVHRKIAFDLFSGVVLKTPVDTGRARGSWRVGIGEINTTVQAAGNAAEVSAVQASGAQALRGLDIERPVWITNSLAYIGALEDGSSQQAPQGFIGLTIAEVKGGLTRLIG